MFIHGKKILKWKACGLYRTRRFLLYPFGEFHENPVGQ